MANPQLEKGHIRLANELAEAFARLQLSGAEWRVLWAIMRCTYGWNKKRDEISVTQFQKLTGLDRRNAHRALKKLISRKIVVKNDNSFIVTYGLQKDYTRWKSLPKLTIATTVVKNDNSTIVKIDNETVVKNDTHKRQKTIKNNPDFISLRKRYSDPGLIDDAFKAIANTRKYGKIADSVKIDQLKKWGRYPVEQVEAGLRIYLDKNYAAEGKREQYLMGIIRNYRTNEYSKKEPDFQPNYLTQKDLYPDEQPATS